MLDSETKRGTAAVWNGAGGALVMTGGAAGRVWSDLRNVEMV